jgi:hypothetical protein
LEEMAKVKKLLWENFSTTFYKISFYHI